MVKSMELGGKAGFLGLEGRGILTGPSRETPYTYSCFTSCVQSAMAVYEEARETQTSQRQQGFMVPQGVFGFSTIIIRVGHYFSTEHFSSRNDLH